MSLPMRCSGFLAACGNYFHLRVVDTSPEIGILCGRVFRPRLLGTSGDVRFVFYTNHYTLEHLSSRG